ncbi:MAG: hypothetical protein QOG62_2576 [Thermoleophilaceae bacterium]|jgi:hypothetical protein|nr:hypothetical protein [Thermoleophilaceae bacterium]
METNTIILIAVGVVAVCAIGALLIAQSRKAAAERRALLGQRAEDHRAEAEANVAKVSALAPERETHAQAAEQHEAEAARHAEAARSHQVAAAELDQRAQVAGRAAGRHDEQAAQAEEEAGRI